MPQFTLSWDNTDLLTNTNVTVVSAVYRYKIVGGTFLVISNTIPKTVKTIDSPILDANKIIEFKTLTSCTQNGPVNNDNGIQEVIEFACINPTISKTENSSTVTLNVSGLDINKARFILRKATGNVIVGIPVEISRISNSISLTAINLIAGTNYYWQIELYSVVSNVEVKSNICSPYAFTTNTPTVCNPVTSLTTSSIEVL